MKKRKFLWLLPYFPYPPVTGGNVRIFNLIKYLSRYYDIHVLSYCDGKIEDRYVKVLQGFCQRVTVVQRKLYDGRLPLIFRHYHTPRMIKELERALKEKFDFIQIDFLTMAYYAFMLKEKVKIPVFFTEHDVSSFCFERCFHNRHLPEKERFIEWTKMRKIADKIYPLFDAVFTVSYNDAEILKEKVPGLNVLAAPTGTDCSYYEFKADRNSNDLVYVGHYFHYPNVDSVRFFLNDVLPHIERKYPHINFNIVGSGGKTVFKDLTRNNVSVTGSVPDIRKYLYNAGVFVAPVRLGVGIRGKILEAMAAGLPVISTELGARGIEAIDEEHVLIADTPKDFVKQLDRLINDKQLRKKLIYNSREFVEDNYNWPIVVEKIIGLYDKLVN